STRGVGRRSNSNSNDRAGYAESPNRSKLMLSWGRREIQFASMTYAAKAPFSRTSSSRPCWIQWTIPPEVPEGTSAPRWLRPSFLAYQHVPEHQVPQVGSM